MTVNLDGYKHIIVVFITVQVLVANGQSLRKTHLAASAHPLRLHTTEVATILTII